LAHFLKVYNRITGRELGYLGSISPTHMMLMSRWRMQTDCTFYLRIMLPSPVHGENCVDFDVYCQWSKPDPGADSFDSGCLILSSSLCHEVLRTSISHYFSFRQTPLS